jgi:hypothetical protein
MGSAVIISSGLLGCALSRRQLPNANQAIARIDEKGQQDEALWVALPKKQSRLRRNMTPGGSVLPRTLKLARAAR